MTRLIKLKPDTFTYEIDGYLYKIYNIEFKEDGSYQYNKSKEFVGNNDYDFFTPSKYPFM